MKVVHIVTTDFGGAFKAVERIQDSLRYYDEQSDILVRSRFFDTDTIEVMNTPSKRFCSKTKNFINLLLSKNEVITDLFGADLTGHPVVMEADVLILHWVNSFISEKSVRKLAGLHKPIIWVMHDMWVFTGGCHYDANCGKYEQNCKECPYLEHKREKGISYFNLKRKQELFRDLDIEFVAVSNWERECAKKSTLLRGRKIDLISNPINIEIFRPMNKEKLRKKYGVGDKKIILFGADKALENKTKGFQYLVEALKYLDGTEYAAICFGKAPEHNRIHLENISINYLGTIHDEEKLAEWYNVADVFVAPSLQEAFGYTVCEALACGTPVTAFGVGGMLDQIVHMENGYLSELYNTRDLARGIVYCANNKTVLGEKAVERVKVGNSYKVIGKKYQEICREAVLSYKNRDLL